MSPSDEYINDSSSKLRHFMKKIDRAYDYREVLKLLDQSNSFNSLGLKLSDSGFRNILGVINASLYSAVLWRDERAIELFLCHNAVACNRTLCEAVRWCNVETLKKLLKNRDLLEQHADAEMTPLHVIAKIKRPDASAFCKILIKYNYDVNARSRSYFLDYGRTALLIAVENHNTDVIQTILRYGADPSIGVGRVGVQIKLCPLFMCFSLPVNIVMDVVKYAALHVSKKEQEKLFSKCFSQSSSGSLFKYYAECCLSEVLILQQQSVGTDNKNLFEFVLSQDQVLKKFFEDNIHEIFNILACLRLPNYKDIILRKFNRGDILDRIVHLTWNIDCANKVSLNSDCMYSICKHICKNDLISLWIALTYKIKTD